MGERVTSAKVAAIAGRILKGKPYSEGEARTLAASVLSQTPLKKLAKARKHG